MLFRYCFFFLLFLSSFFNSTAQDTSPVQFRFETRPLSGDTVLLQIRAVLSGEGRLYSSKPFSEAAPIHTEILIDTSANYRVLDSIVETGNLQSAGEPDFEGDNTVFVGDSLLWSQRVLLTKDSSFVTGTVRYFVKSGGAFNNFEESFRVKAGKVSAAPSATAAAEGEEPSRSLIWIFGASFLGGLLALITPCVYSMIPVTVSFFTKRSKTRQQGVRNAVYYSLSLIIIFTLLGFLVTIIFGPAALNKLATNWIANLAFFLIFLVFGISFLGAFDIQLPSSWTNKADSKAGTGNFWGIFFMALTLALVSFSCTGPIIGNLIVLASKGSFLGPLVGMFGFSLALALPFTLFALFPGWINGLSKSGGWLNSVKVTLGFLELALALKFLSNADLAQGWRLLDREIFLCLWIVIFALLGLYLLGKLRFHHDSELPKNDFGLPYLSIPRLFLSMTSFAFALYMIPGLWGAPLRGISAFLPPYGTQDYTTNTTAAVAATGHGDTTVPHPVKYVKELSPLEPEVVKKFGLVTFFDYDEALAASRKVKKPLMLDFTGINCINCRKMEAQVWSHPEVMRRLKENFVIASLYTDVQNVKLPEEEEFDSEALDERVNTVGEKFAHLQVSRFGSLTQPYYFFLDGTEKKLAPEGYPYDPDVQKFIKHLDAVVAAYKSGNVSAQ